MVGKQGSKLFGMDAAGKSFGVDMLKKEDVALWLVAQLHPSGTKCPHCTFPVTAKAMSRYCNLEQIRCPECKKKFTAATGTLLNGAKLEPSEIYLLAVLSHLGVAAPRIAGVLRCHVDTITNWQAHFKAQRELAGA